MLQGSKIILVTSRCTLLLFCLTVIEAVVGDWRNKCCCGKRRTQQDLSVGCELLCLRAGSPVWAQQKSRELWPSSKKFRSSELGKCTIVKGWENTKYLKLNSAGCVSCTGLRGYQGMPVPAALKAVASTQKVTEQDGLSWTELFHWGFWSIQTSNFLAAGKPSKSTRINCRGLWNPRSAVLDFVFVYSYFVSLLYQ